MRDLKIAGLVVAVIGAGVWLGLRERLKSDRGGARVLSPADRLSPADAGLGPRLGTFPVARLRSSECRWILVVEHSGRALTEADVRAALPRAYSDTPFETGKPDVPASLRLVHRERPEFAPPTESELTYFARGLSPADTRRARELKRATAILASSRPDAVANGFLRATQDMAVRLAESRNGFIWDDTSRELFTPQALKERRLREGALEVRAHMTMHAYRSGDLIRVVTLGMQKFGLPDLVIEESVGDKTTGDLINLAAQLLVEGASLSSEGKLHLDLDALRDAAIRRRMTGTLLKGARRSADVMALKGRRDQGDPENELLELWFGEPPQQKQDEVAARIWGNEDDTALVRHDAAIQEESRREREKVLRELKPRFQRGELEHRHLKVKLPFREGGQTEWMWVEVLRWPGPQLVGILKNVPKFVRLASAGAQVAGSEEDIFDYTLDLPDGGVEGNTTAPLISARQAR